MTDLVNMVTDYAAVPNAKWVITTFTLHSGTKILTASAPLFFPADVGKTVLLPPLPFGNVFFSRIASYASATQVVLTDNSPYEYDAYEAILSWGTDSTPMFQQFKDDWQGYSDIVLTIPAGIYLIASGNFGGLWDGIHEITVNATGATLAGGMFQVQAAAQYQFPPHTGYTATVLAGSSSVTLLDPADASKFVVGNWAMMTGFDMMKYGYPTNNGILEYHKIASIAGAVITFETPLAYSYKSTWPLYIGESLVGLGSQTMGGPATLYAMNPNFEHTCVVNGLTIAQHNQYGVSGLDLTFNDCTFEGVGQIGPHPTMAHRVIFNNCHAPGVLLEVDKLVDLIEVNGGTWRVLNYQSGNSIRETILDNTTVTESIIGSSWKFTVRNGCVINLWGLAPPFFGYTREFSVSNSVIENWPTGNLGLSIRNFDGGAADGVQHDGTMVAGVLTIPVAYRMLSPSQWAIAGESMTVIDTALGTIGVFTILDVADATPGGDLVITTTWPGGWPAALGTVWLNTHPATACTVTNSTGCIEIEELSLAPAGKPFGSYFNRTFDGSVLGQNSPSGVIFGTLKYIRVTVTKAYTGVASTFRAQVFPGWGIDPASYGTNTNLQFMVNLKTTGTRILDLTSPSYPVSWTGVQTGDVLAAHTKTYWVAGNFFIVIPDADISGESPAVWPEFTVEAKTDQGLYAPSIVPEPPETTAQAVFWLNYIPEVIAPPAITSPATASVNENNTLAHALTADAAVTWSIVGGDDSAKFEISGVTLRWTGDGTKDFEAPDDADANNTYVVTVRATGAGGTASQGVTVTVTDIDDTAPGITSPNTSNVDEDLTLAHGLTATESVTWTIVGGADAAEFEISGATLRWAGNGVQDYDAPADADTNNAYVVTVRATDTSGNATDQTVTVTVIEVATALADETLHVVDLLVAGTTDSIATLLLPHDFT